MRVMFTVLDHTRNSEVDLLLTAPDDVRVGAVASAVGSVITDMRPGAARSSRQSAAWAAPTLYVAGRPLDPDLPLALSSLREGSEVRLDVPSPRRTQRPGLVDLRIVGGPGAGVVHALPAGEFTVGSAPSCAVVIASGGLREPAMTIQVEVDGRSTVVPGPDAEVRADGATAPDDGTTTVQVGPVTLALVRTPGVPLPAAASATVPGQLDVNRPPRLHPPVPESAFTLPVEPVAPRRAPIPVLMTILPLVAAVGLAALLRTVYVLLFALLAPVSLVASVMSGRRRDGREFRAETAAHRRRRDEVEEAARRALSAECAQRRANHPDPAAILMAARGPGEPLWQRRRLDPDYLQLRLGTADLPSDVRCIDPRPAVGQDQVWTAADVPAVVSLAERDVLGVTGPGTIPQILGCWLVAQAAVLHSPRDLRIYLLIGPAGNADAWRWIRWLPHARPFYGQEATVLIGLDETGWRIRVDELTALIESRRTSRARTPEADRDGPDVLVILDGARELRTVPGMSTVLRAGPRVGVRAVCLEADARSLPAECQAIVEPADGPPGHDGHNLRLRQNRAPVVAGIRPDLIAVTGAGAGAGAGGSPPDGASLASSAAWCEAVGRSLAPLRDASDTNRVALPPTVRLLDLLDLSSPTAARVADRWSERSERHPASPGRPVPIGVSATGRFEIDLTRDGPHGLIAGTTGAGKSELLQTFVAAHAAMYRPDEMTFVLVDYKGGSAFAECEALPHTVGLVTDLDPHLVRRALTSLNAELHRREHLLASVGARDLDDYRRLALPPGPHPTLPRLLLIVDEFATLARELPEFVTGLVGLAQRGRSLGIHLLLATQRPGGSVSPEIRANTSLRIALRVTDVAESTDIVGSADAALISPATPGRALVRIGPDAVVAVQSGRVGGEFPAHLTSRGTEGRAETRPHVAVMPWAALGLRAPGAAEATSAATPTARRPASGGPGRFRPHSGDADRDGSPARRHATDLERFVDAAREAWTGSGFGPPHSPWLPPLPERIIIDDLPDAIARVGPVPPAGHRDRDAAGDRHRRPPVVEVPRTGRGALAPLTPVAIGRSDICERQLQPPFTIDIEHGSHLMIVGSARSGRSTTLRTAAGAVATATSPDAVHLYGLDCGDNALAPLVALPHTGAVVSRNEPERVARLLARLADEIKQRQSILARGGHTDLTEARRAWALRPRPTGGADVPPPYLILLLDRFEGFLADFEDLDGGALVEHLLRLMREGPSAGLRVLLTTDRRGLTGRLASLIEERLILRMAERSDYALAGLSPTDVPESLPPGRGCAIGGRFTGAVETQIALLAADPSGQAQVAALHALGARSTSASGPRGGSGPDERRDTGRPDTGRPFRIDVLPSSVTAGQLPRPRRPGRPRAAWSAHPSPGRRRLARNDDSPLIAVIGLGGNELTAVDVDLTSDGPGFVIGGPPRSGRSSALLTLALAFLADGVRVMAFAPRPSPLRLLAGRRGMAGVFDGHGDVGPALFPPLVNAAQARTVVLVDDAELVSPELASGLASFGRGARDTGGALVIAGTTEDLMGQYHGFVVDARRGGHGLLLTPARPGDGELLGVRLSHLVTGPAPPGRGVLVRRRVLLPVQVALSAPDEPEEAAEPTEPVEPSPAAF